MGEWAVENWLGADAVETGVEYSEYWNNPEFEREKPFHVLDGNFSKMESYLSDVGLAEDLNSCVAVVNHELGRSLRGQGIDLAAGTLWAAPALLAAGPVEKLYCLEYSKHRLLEIGPRVLDHYGVGNGQVVLAYGSFYKLELPDDELDFAFLCQAFHHADRPAELLEEIRRVLRPDGLAIVIGEHLIGPRAYLTFAARLVLSVLVPRRLRERMFGRGSTVRRTLRPRGEDLVPTDPVLGDHSYNRREYLRLFEGHGFSARRVRRRGSTYQGFVLEQQSAPS